MTYYIVVSATNSLLITNELFIDYYNLSTVKVYLGKQEKRKKLF